MAKQEQGLDQKIKGKELETELDYFQLFFNDEILDLFVEESNNYYSKLLRDKYGSDFKNVILTSCNNHPNKAYQYYYVTRGITKKDILTFIGIKIFMGLHKYPSLKSYWDAKYSSGNLNFNKIMSINYYYLVSKALHFPEKEDSGSSSSEKDSSACTDDIENDARADPRQKINLYLEKLAQNFQKNYELGENLTIDESLVHFKGRNSMKFYIPMKPHKWGFKIHLLCDADTHYLYNMLFDPGKRGKDFIALDNCCSLSESIVLKLLSCIKDNHEKRRNVFFDGWYSSLSLMKKLTKMGYLNTTVLRATSKDLPPKIKTEGYDKAYCDEIIIQKYEGKKTIYFATNYKIDIEELRNIYNIKNRGVDIFDQYLSCSSSQRRTLKWYKKIFLFGIDSAIINAKVIYELKTGKKVTTVQFKEKLYDQIFRVTVGKKAIIPSKRQYTRRNQQSKEIPELKSYTIQQDPLDTYFHNIGNNINNEGNCKGCGQPTSYFCVECRVHLHSQCFVKYHTFL